MHMPAESEGARGRLHVEDCANDHLRGEETNEQVEDVDPQAIGDDVPPCQSVEEAAIPLQIMYIWQQASVDRHRRQAPSWPQARFLHTSWRCWRCCCRGM